MYLNVVGLGRKAKGLKTIAYSHTFHETFSLAKTGSNSFPLPRTFLATCQLHLPLSQTAQTDPEDRSIRLHSFTIPGTIISIVPNIKRLNNFQITGAESVTSQ
jgi:hypothetical protein